MSRSRTAAAVALSLLTLGCQPREVPEVSLVERSPRLLEVVDLESGELLGFVRGEGSRVYVKDGALETVKERLAATGDESLLRVPLGTSTRAHRVLPLGQLSPTTVIAPGDQLLFRDRACFDVRPGDCLVDTRNGRLARMVAGAYLCLPRPGGECTITEFRPATVELHSNDVSCRGGGRRARVYVPFCG